MSAPRVVNMDGVNAARLDEIPVIVGQLHEALAALDIRLRLLTQPQPPVPVQPQAEEGSHLPAVLDPIDIARDLNLRTTRGPRRGEISAKRVYEFARRRGTPDLPQLPTLRHGHTFRVDRASYLAWKKSYLESGRE